VGTFTATLSGALTSYPTQKASTTFTITVKDPCPESTLVAVASLNLMSYTLYQVPTSSQQSPSFQVFRLDQVTVCGGFSYSISDTTLGSVVTKLTAAEL